MTTVPIDDHFAALAAHPYGQRQPLVDHNRAARAQLASSMALVDDRSLIAGPLRELGGRSIARLDRELLALTGRLLSKSW
jgi:hypothetical protein